MFGTIILRDIPQQRVRIDLAYYDIRSGFRGFRMVPPVSWHYVSVKAEKRSVGFWCSLMPQQTVIKIFNHNTKQFDDADPDGQKSDAGLASSDSAETFLMTYPHARFGPWFGLVNHITTNNFPPQLHEEHASSSTRFDQAFLETHSGDAASFLAEFQYAFVRWLVSLDDAMADQTAFARWRYLLLSAYNAGENRIRASGNLFPQLVDTLLRQFPLLPDEWFEADSFLLKQAGFLMEDMRDSGNSAIVEQGQQFEEYVKRRIASIAAVPKDDTENVIETDAQGDHVMKLKNKKDILRITGRKDRLRALFLFEYEIQVDDITEIWLEFESKTVEFHLADRIFRFRVLPDAPYDVIRPTKENIQRLEQMFDPALQMSLAEIFTLYQEP